MFVELRFRQPETWIKDIKLKQRIISALIAIPLFLAIILFAPQPIYLAFWHLCIIACSYEFFKIRGLSKINSLITAAVVGSIAPVVCYLWKYAHLSENMKITIFFIISCLSILIPIIWVFIIPKMFKKYNKNQDYKGNNVILFLLWFLIITYFYIFAFLSTFDAGFNPRGLQFRIILLLTLVTIWANDAGAYFVGKAIGKRKFSPIISPNKTWEGFWGGMVVALIVSIIVNVLFFWTFEHDYAGALIYALLTAPLISIFATIGDLFQSMLKRMAGVKDSGNIMPGHGGVFDRIDSWLAVGSLSAVLYLFFMLLALIVIPDCCDFSSNLMKFPAIIRVAYM